MTDLYDPDGSGVLVTRKEMASTEQYFRQMLNAETMMLAMRKELERQFPAGFWEFPDCFVTNSTSPPDTDFETWSGIPLTGPISGEVLVSVFDSRRMRLAYPHRPDSKRRRKQRLQKRARRIIRLNRK